MAIFLISFISYSYFNFFKKSDDVQQLFGALRAKIFRQHLLVITVLFGLSLILVALINLITSAQVIRQALPAYVIIYLSILAVYSGIFCFYKQEWRQGDA